jgi:L-lactate dehydrogenase complex protein LldE
MGAPFRYGAAFHNPSIVPGVRVGLFVTCLVDLFRPSIGLAAVELLEAAGCEVIVPATQTCCGQPGYNSGDRASARALAEKVLNELEDVEYVVAPSGSCSGMIRVHYPALFRDDRTLAERAGRLAAKTYELTDFLVNKAPLREVPGRFSGTVAYHDCCAGLREMGVKAQPRALLAKLEGIEMRELAECEQCCGFGGTFSIKFGDVSAAIADRKCENVTASGAGTLVLGDLGCMLNIEGRMRRRGDLTTRVLHVAEVLAGDDGRVG